MNKKDTVFTIKEGKNGLECEYYVPSKYMDKISQLKNMTASTIIDYALNHKSSFNLRRYYVGDNLNVLFTNSNLVIALHNPQNMKSYHSYSKLNKVISNDFNRKVPNKKLKLIKEYKKLGYALTAVGIGVYLASSLVKVDSNITPITVPIEAIDDKSIDTSNVNQTVNVSNTNQITIETVNDYWTNPITFIANAYGMDEVGVRNLSKELLNKDLDNLTNEDYELIQHAVAKMYFANTNAYKKGITSNGDDIEKDIIMACKIYGITDQNTVATILAIPRHEVGNNYESITANNIAGLMGSDGKLLSFPTTSASAFSLVLTVLNDIDELQENNTYNYTKSMAYNIGPLYCMDDTLYAKDGWIEDVTNKANIYLTKDIVNNYNNEYRVNEELVRR